MRLTLPVLFLVSLSLCFCSRGQAPPMMPLAAPPSPSSSELAAPPTGTAESSVPSAGSSGAVQPAPSAEAAAEDGSSGDSAPRGVEVVAPVGEAEPEAGDQPCTLAVPGMICIPAGEFIRGVEVDAHECAQPDQVTSDPPTTAPSMTVAMSTYYIDETEVTNEAYERCVGAGVCVESGARYVDFDRGRQPIVGVSWFEARAFCEWAGKSLPSEAQWERAARGDDGARTPFGDADVTCDEAIIMDASGRSCGQRKERGEHPETGRVALVGSRPPGVWGAYDMVGNAEEWVADWWSESWAACGPSCVGPDPLGPCDGADVCDGRRMRVVRGGSWYWPTGHATGYHRRRHYPSNSPFHHFGFRCAASESQALALTASAASDGSGE